MKNTAFYKGISKVWAPGGVEIGSLLDLLADIVGSALFAAGLVCFAENAQFAPGGITGIALIIRHYFPIVPLGLCAMLLNIPLILLTYKTLGGWRYFVKALRSSIVLTLIMDLVFPHLPTYTGEPILAALFGGLLAGIGLSFIYMRGSCVGGSDYIIFAVKKKRPHLSFGAVSMAADLVIILSGWLVFGNIDAVLKGLVMTIAFSFAANKLLYGAGSKKLTVIISEHGKEIAAKISTHFERGSTLIKGMGAYSGSEKDVLLCACDKSQSATVHRLVYTIDSHALIMQATLDEVRGEGFKELEKEA